MADGRALAEVRTFPQLIAYLRDELGWPIQSPDFEELTFDYTPEELGIDPGNAAKIQEVKRLRPLSAHQPWGIFFVEFEPKSLPVVALRRILGSVIAKKRSTAGAAERVVWQMDDLLFVSSHGDADHHQLTFAHFAQPDDPRALPTLRVLGWDDLDTVLHLRHVSDTLEARLAWPDDESDTAAWREKWRSAFVHGHRETISTSRTLALRLAELAKAIRRRTEAVLAVETTGPISSMLNDFRRALVHDLELEDFADMYAQTVAYGMLSARISGRYASGTGLSEMLPTLNPFLADLMQTMLHTAGPASVDFDELGVGEVIELLEAADMDAVLRDFGDKNPDEDPVIHFYERFLDAYDPRRRMERGVFYTPRPVVRRIVLEVDRVLREDFGLDLGLADTSTWQQVAARHPTLTLPPGVDDSMPFVQVLDPAVGTATFLVEIIELVHERMLSVWRSEGQLNLEDLWDSYVSSHLLNILHGFELMMAPYAIAHVKIALKLLETGYTFKATDRTHVYLTNTLEPPADYSGRFEFAVPALAREAAQVSDVKANRRFTVLVGNPPYYAEAGRGGEWIAALMRGYDHEVREPTYDYFASGGKRLAERTMKWLNDDYVKFLRYASRTVEVTGSGVIAFITNHGYLDNPTFRGMRESLVQQFSLVRVLDLHGNAVKRERAPDGGPDENVFDIRQGVAISVLCHAPPVERRTTVEWAEVWGLRKAKYRALMEAASGQWLALDPSAPDFVLIPRDQALAAEYEIWPRLTSIMPIYGHGIITKRDSLTLHFTPDEVWETVRRFAAMAPEDARAAFDLPDDVRDWSVRRAQEDLLAEPLDRSRIRRLLYRPFNWRYTYYTGRARGFIGWPVENVMRNMIGTDNLAIVTTRQTRDQWDALVTADLVGHKAVSAYDINTVFPVRIVTGPVWQDTATLHANVARGQLPMLDDLSVEDAVAYIYAVFRSSGFRDRYRSVLASAYPRVPAARNQQLQADLAKLGRLLLDLHLLRSTHPTVRYEGEPSLVLARARYSDGTVELQGKSSDHIGTLAPVDPAIWHYRVGGYQVCDKWFKDRRGRLLTDEDREEFGHIVDSLARARDVEKDIDELIQYHGGWPGAFRPASMDSGG